MLYCKMSREDSTAFSTREASQTRQAQQVSQVLVAHKAMQALPRLVLHFTDNDQDREFKTPDSKIPGVPKHVS